MDEWVVNSQGSVMTPDGHLVRAVTVLERVRELEAAIRQAADHLDASDEDHARSVGDDLRRALRAER